MSVQVRVNGGTNAGTRIVNVRPEWECACVVWVESDDGFPPLALDRRHPGHRYSCPDCGARRP